MRYRYWLAGGAIAGLVLGHLAYLRLGPEYEASAQILVSRRNSVPLKEEQRTLSDWGDRSEHIALIMSPMIVNKAVEIGHLKELQAFRGSTDIAGITLIAHPMDVAELSVLYVMLVGVMDPVRKLSTTYAKLKRANAAGDRIFGLLDTTPIVKQAEEPKPAIRHTDSIEFRRVGFSYPVQDESAIRPAASG